MNTLSYHLHLACSDRRAPKYQDWLRTSCLASPLAALVYLAFALDLCADDWPQYRGPNHDGISLETIRTNWSEKAPQVVWKIPLEPGLSSFSVSGNQAFTQVRRRVGSQDQEVCIALSTTTGEELWATPLGIADYPDGGVGADDGPRSTPSVHGNRVFVLTSYLRMACLDSADGRIVWSNDYGPGVISWQNAASPLLEDGLIFLNCNAPQNRLLALHESDGSQAWKGQNDVMTQSSPIAATAAGVRQIIFFAQSGLVAVEPSSGTVFWRYPMPFSISTAASPVAANDAVYCSAAYGIGAGTVKITGSGASLKSTELWRTPGGSMNHWATPIHYNGYLFGVYGQAGPTTTLRCLELATGSEKWRQPGVGSGGVLGVAGLVLVLTENGYLVLVNPDPVSYSEVDRYRALDGSSNSIPGLTVKCWNVPAISNGRIYARSTTEAVCLDVAPALPPLPPPLELTGTLSDDGQTFRLFVSNQDNSPLDTNRVARLDVLASTNLGLGLDSWSKTLEPLVLTNGQLLLEDPQVTSTPQRYFRVEEHP